MPPEPGFGSRHPDLAALLAERRCAGWTETAWLDGTMPLRIGAYLEPADVLAGVPPVLVSSVRCIVRVGTQVVLCENTSGRHVWPGGRREPGESYADTAVREVHEETGWLLDRASLRPLGWLHLEHQAARRPDDHYPYPDLVQVVFTATAAERDGGPDVAWVDTDGFEQWSGLVTVAQARTTVTPDWPMAVFLDAITGSG